MKAYRAVNEVLEAKTQNKCIFYALFAYKKQMEQDFGAPLTGIGQGDDKISSQILFDITKIDRG